MLEWVILGAAALAGAKSIADEKAKREQEKHLWFGHMQCGACGYLWTSRKKTPPARCPRCRSAAIGLILGR